MCMYHTLLSFRHCTFLTQCICVFRPNLALNSYFRFSNIKYMFLIIEKQRLYFEVFLLDNNLASQDSYT